MDCTKYGQPARCMHCVLRQSNLWQSIRSILVSDKMCVFDNQIFFTNRLLFDALFLDRFEYPCVFFIRNFFLSLGMVTVVVDESA